MLAEFVRVRDDLELVERQQVDRRFGVATEVQDYAGSTTLLGYDALGRVTRVVRPGDSEQLPSVSYAYELAAPLSRVTTELRRFSGHAEVDSAEDLIDGAGRKRASIVPDGTGADERWAISGVQLFDARGSAWRSVRARMAGPGERTSPDLQMDGPGDSSWRDAVGRSIRTLTNAGLQSRTEYHPLQKHYWDPGRANPASPYDKTPSVEAVDGLGRITSATRHLSQVAHSADFAWNAAGDLLSRTDPEGNVASYQYDGRGRRIAVVDPDVGKRGLVWDKTDNLVERRQPDGTVLRFDYDLVGRLIREDWGGDGKPDVENVWDVHPGQPGDTSFRGKLVQTRDATGVTDHSYDHRGRSSATRLNIQGQLVSTESHFDAQDREYLHVYPDKSSIRIHYNARGQVSAYGKAVEFHYDPDGVELQRTFNTGVVQHAGYDDDRKLREIRALSASGQVIEHVRRTYDLAGNVTKIEDLRPNVPAAENRSESYSYDDFYRLVVAEGSW
ncbi:MAG TPA: hypothetical protein PKA88_30250, partial [Polyangiaceae bacterium]|nr:hypothetical protein [Polyangiaceae bacterium]